MPISSALFNRDFRAGLLALDVPLAVKVIALEDITMVAESVPVEYRQVVIDLLTRSVQKTFLVGLGCAVACGVIVFAIPWKPIRVDMTQANLWSNRKGQGCGLPFWRTRPKEAGA